MSVPNITGENNRPLFIPLSGKNFGADHEVTGSCHFMEVGGKNFCVDIGMEQGQDLNRLMSVPDITGEDNRPLFIPLSGKNFN